MRHQDPFMTRHVPGRGWVGATDATSRKNMVRDFTADQCRAALKVSGLQTTVLSAVERRLRQLQREGLA